MVNINEASNSLVKKAKRSEQSAIRYDSGSGDPALRPVRRYLLGENRSKNFGKNHPRTLQKDAAGVAETLVRTQETVRSDSLRGKILVTLHSSNRLRQQ